MLALNGDKTEIVHFSSKFTGKGAVPRSDVYIGGVSISPKESVRNLGVIMDSSGTMSDYVAKVCKSASFSLWKIGRIRNLLDQSTTEKLIHAFITSRLDYCNSLLFGLPSHQIKKLQLIQNSAARLITGTRKFEHITPVLKTLHWLPVQQRTKFKMLCITHKILQGVAPAYLEELLTKHVPGRSLRNTSNGEIYLRQPRECNSFYGGRAFSVSAPKLWNSLPRNLLAIENFTSFKCNLKTHLFNEYF